MLALKIRFRVFFCHFEKRLKVLNDQIYMTKVLQLAKKGAGFTSPNPMVGCIIVKNNKIIGEGFHHNYGGKHAEIEAIDNATESVEGATLYCNLEPCCHNIPEKKTPPCTERILKEKLSRVVVGMKDPNPYVNGKGIDVLKENNIMVEVGICGDECVSLNEKYIKYITTGIPFVHLKIAQSLDGRIAASNGSSHWITNKKARKLVHQMRAVYDAVLIGAKTCLMDNPSLTVREIHGRNPYRIVLDENLIIPDHSNLLSDEFQDHTIIFTSLLPDHPRVAQLLSQEIQVISLEKNNRGFLNILDVLKKLSELNIASVLVEGGGEIFTSFIKEKMFDKISLFLAPILIGEGIQGIGNLGIRSLSDVLRLKRVTIKTIDNQALIEGYRNFNFKTKKGI
jgi:diaminohydroxyphosphoribosylaminopyrimidine deaminase/5-amino-6-(5-phosphoribosylamino)uracil reductase